MNGAPTYTDQLQIPASGLRPERATAYEVGLDVRLFDERVGLDVTAYTQLNEDQILALPTPISSGYESRVVNGGSVRAEGIEAVVNFRAVRRGHFRYDATINFNTALATVVSLPDGRGHDPSVLPGVQYARTDGLHSSPRRAVASAICTVRATSATTPGSTS